MGQAINAARGPTRLAAPILQALPASLESSGHNHSLFPPLARDEQLT
jgi:hypothetical protein